MTASPREVYFADFALEYVQWGIVQECTAEQEGRARRGEPERMTSDERLRQMAANASRACARGAP